MKRKSWKMTEIVLLFSFVLASIPGLSQAQEFPTRPINIFSAYGPGTTTDVAGRILAGKAEKLLGQPMILINNPTAGGTIILSQIARAKPDGYNLVQHTSVGLAWFPQLRKVNYKFEDFTYILQWGRPLGTAILARADAPYKTVRELVEYARKNPVNYGATTKGTPKQTVMEFIAKKAGIQWTFIPFDGDNLTLSALLGGHIHAATSGTSYIPFVQQGKLRLLAVFSEGGRAKMFPDVPTLQEQGYDYFDPATFLFAGPKGMPPSIVNKLGEAFHKSMDDPEFIKIMATSAFEPAYRNPADLKKYIEEVHARAEKLVKDLNLRKDE